MTMPLAFTWPYVAIFLGVWWWAFWPEFKIVRRAQRERTPTDAKSISVIVYGGGFLGGVAFFVAWLPAAQDRSHRLPMFIAGILLLILGSLFRRHCFRMLGTSFTGDVRARTDQEVVTRGAYSVLRHPSYTAATIMNVAMGLVLGSWVSVFLMLVTSFLVYGYRIRVEERALEAAIGDPYREFMRTRKRLIPFLY
jgi:protein-S-isoprenylcysteine O-methyltransferase Ste14